MAQDTESFNNELYNLLKVRGYKPVPLNSQNQRVGASQQADVMEFTFTKDGEDYGKAWISVDDASNLKIYFDNEQQDSPDTKTPGVDYDDTWTGLLKHLKSWGQRRQLSFELANKDRLGDDMRQRDYYKMKEKLGESKKIDELATDTEDSYYKKAVKQKTAAALTRHYRKFDDLPKDVQDRIIQTFDKRKRGIDRFANKYSNELSKPMDQQRPTLQVNEGYHAMGKKASYNDAVPSVKIILQHNRALEEGEARFRNVARIFLENTDGERFLAPTTKPGLARVFAREIAEGGKVNGERWNHLKDLCEEYQKMAGFVRATRNGQFNESAQKLVNEGINHYNNLRETLHKLSTHRGYHTYFESYTPTLMEGDDEDLSEMFMSQSLDPRIESVMPILSRLHKPIKEMEELDNLAEWADGIINEKLELDELSPATRWSYTDKGRDSLDTLMSKVADAEDIETAKKYADKAVKRQYTIDKTEKALARGSKVQEKMDSTTASLAVPADKMLEAPGAETLSHNQSTEKSNLKAFDLAEQGKEDQPIGKGKNAYIVTGVDGKKVTVLADYHWQAKDIAKKHWGLSTDSGIRVVPKTAPEPASTSKDITTPNKAGSAYSQAATSAAGDDTEKQGEPTTTWQRVKQAVKKNWNVPGGDDSYGGVAKALGGLLGVSEGDVVPFKKKDEDDLDDDSWIPSIDDFEQEEKHKNRKPKAANDVNEMDKEHGSKRDFDGPRGQDKTAKMITAKKATKDARKALDKAFRGELEEELTPVPSGHKGLNKQQKAAGQVGPTEKAKNISPVLGKEPKKHPFNGKLVGAESKEIDPELARIMEIAGIKR